MKTIELTRGKQAVVDDADFPVLSAMKWHLVDTGSGHFYAGAYIKRKRITMHRFLLGIENASEPFVDHRDGDGLNNRRGNIRACSQSQNLHNQRKRRKGASSRFKGVCWCSRSRKWRATIGKDVRYLGVFDSEEAAALAYNVAAAEQFGEFARLNQLEA